jgi:predicted TIM-barrel fold metal-dependent hydrolase
LGFGRASSVIEYTFDTARNINNAIHSGAFQRYPGLKLILSHAGAALPTLAWRIAELTDLRGLTDAEVGPEQVGQVLRGLYYDTALAGGPHSLLPTLQVTSADHILYGTDFPAAAPLAMERAIANFSTFEGLNDAERAGVERNNVTLLFPRLR